ncbi:hypothetical protein PHET_12070, partial [Paragonimus heterotremus]
NSIDTTSFTICHKVIGPQHYEELCTHDFTVQRLNHTDYMYQIDMNLHVGFPKAFVGRWCTQLFNSTGGLLLSSSIAIGVTTN